MSDIAFPLTLSLLIATCSAVLCTIVGVPLAYLIATREFRGKALLDVVLTLPLVLPPIVTGYYLLLLVGRAGLLGILTQRLFGQPIQISFTWGAAVLAAFVVSLPFTVKTARASIEAVDRDLVRASYCLGRSETYTAFRVVLPIALPGIVAGLALSFARALGEFGATIMVAGNIPGRTNTMPLEIYNAVIYGDWHTATVLVAFFTCVSAAFLLAVNRLSPRVMP